MKITIQTATALAAATVLGCSAGDGSASSDEQEAKSGRSTIEFKAIRFDANDPPAGFQPNPSAPLAAGGKATVIYPAARFPAVDVSCAPGTPTRMGSMINKDPQRVTETALVSERATLTLPRDTSKLDLWFVCRGTNGQDQFDNANPLHVKGGTDNYGYSVAGGSGLMFAGSVGPASDVLGNSFRVFVTDVRSGGRTVTDPIVQDVSLTVEYSDFARAFEGASSLTAIANLVIRDAFADGHVDTRLDNNHHLVLKRDAQGKFVGMLPHAFHTERTTGADEVVSVTAVDFAFTANGKFDSNNGANYRIDLGRNRTLLP